MMVKWTYFQAWPIINTQLLTWKKLYEMQNVARLKVARSDFWVTIPFNFDRLEHNHYQSNRKSNFGEVLEKDESFK